MLTVKQLRVNRSRTVNTVRVGASLTDGAVSHIYDVQDQLIHVGLIPKCFINLPNNLKCHLFMTFPIEQCVCLEFRGELVQNQY